jgi:hypothetical protein
LDIDRLCADQLQNGLSAHGRVNALKKGGELVFTAAPPLSSPFFFSYRTAIFRNH